MLHSLVRVSRRVGCSHLITNNYSARCDQSPVRADIRQQTLHAVPAAVPKRPEAAQAEGLHCQFILSHPQTARRMAISFTPRNNHLPNRPSEPRATVVGQLCTRVQRSRRLSGEQNLSAFADRHRPSTSLLNLSRANSAAFASLLTVSRSF